MEIINVQRTYEPGDYRRALQEKRRHSNQQDRSKEVKVDVEYLIGKPPEERVRILEQIVRINLEF